MKDSKYSSLPFVFNKKGGLSIWLAFLLVFTTGCEWFEDDDDPEPDPPSSINTLASLSVSEGVLSPAFSANTFSYNVDVDNAVTSIQITAVLVSDVSSLQINGSAESSGVASSPIDLDEGVNTIEVVVTAENDDASTTTITVNRASPPELSVLLTSLQLSDIEFTPAFDSETIQYSATVSSEVESTIMTAVAEDENATLYYGSEGPLASGASSSPITLEVGENFLSVEVHSADDLNSKLYNISIVRNAPLGEDATLDSLEISTGTLSPVFSSDIFNYSASVGFEIESITVTPELSDQNASISINGTPAVNGQPSDPIVLNEGENDISLLVTAENGNTTETYNVTVTRQSASLFAQQAYIKASNPDQFDEFGWAVDLDGDTLVVGAEGEDSNSTGVNGEQTNNLATESGAVYVFVREAESWSQQAYIKASNAENGDQFGLALAIEGNTLVVGAQGEDSNATGVNGDENSNNLLASGAAYVFVRVDGNWTQQAYLKASAPSASDGFGNSVSISGDTIAIGASNQDDNTGSVYLFTRINSQWSQQANVNASNAERYDSFGESISLSGDTLAVGAPREASNSTGIDQDQTNNDADYAGAVYIFTREGVEWSQQSYIKASNTDINDQFGNSVSLFENTLAVGAYRESGNATGINGDETNNEMSRSGAVYVFERTSGIWQQQAYIKASNTETIDFFGWRVDLQDDILAVGADAEDGGAAGVFEDQPDDSRISNSGAAYIFERHSGEWSQKAYVKASNPSVGDLFGSNMSISNGTLVVTARGEQSSAPGINGDQSINTLNYAGAAYVFLIGEVAEITDNADLISFHLGENELTPSFNSDTTEYTVSVSQGQSSITVLATTADDDASLTINGEAATSGVLFESVPLEMGENTIEVVVTAQDATTAKSYTVIVTRQEEASSDALLSGLSTSAGTLSPGFDSMTFNYASDVSFATSTITVTPVLSDPNASVTVNGSLTDSGTASVPIQLNEGPNNITLDVLAEDGTTGETYVIIVTRESATQFAQRAYMKASNTGSGDRFGYSVDFNGNTLVVGAPWESSASTGVNSDQTDDSAETAGAAYVFVRDLDDNWTQQAYLKASNTDSGDRFGIDVSIDGDTIAIGADQERSNATLVDGNQSDNSTNFSGAVYIYTRSGTTWSQQAYVKAATNFGFNYFGANVSLDGDRLAVGSVGGRVTTYTRLSGVWAFEAELTASNFDSGDRFGATIDLDGNSMIIGAYFEDSSATGVNGDTNDNATDSGAAYIFTYSNGFWSQQAYLKASNTEPNDLFGFSVAIDGDLAVVGATQESSSSTGIDGDGSNNDSNRSGAVYVFSRSGSSWSQQSYIKASNTNSNDTFGNSVDIDGGQLVVGAQWEASSATGSGGDQTDNTLSQAGAVYLFNSSGVGDWAQSAYIKASNTNAGDYFGRSVSLYDGELIVGADVEDSSATGINGDENNNSSFNAGAVYLIDAQ